VTGAPSSRTRLDGLGTLGRTASFSAQFAVVDAVVRGPRGYAQHPGALAGLVASVALWALLATSGAGRATRAGLALFAAATLVVDGLVYRYYGTLLDLQVVASAAHGWADVRPIAIRLLPAAIGLTALVFAVEYRWLPALPIAPSRGAQAVLAAIVLGSVALAPPGGLTPELRVIAASRVLWGPRRPASAAAPRLPLLPSSRDEAPSIILVLTESVGASSYCSDPNGACALSPEVSALFPDRVPLRQLRSVASYTALSVAALFTGRPLAGASDPVAALPTVFDFVRAVRVDGRAPYVAYWSAQASTVLDRDLRGSVDSLITQESLLGRRFEDEDDAVEMDPDRRLSERCVAELPRLPRPFFLVLHLLGTHAPYFIDPTRAPFQPTQQVVTWAGLPHLRNAYHDAIYAQDHALAACLSAFVEQQKESPWVVLLTSDHGEAFGEHGAIHHGQNLYDEQVHVPGWVAASGRALDDEQRRNLAAHADAFVTHLDLVPTILDALGALNGLAMAPVRAALPGRSLLARPSVAAPVPVTNCTTVFPCPLNTWGMLGEGRALVAQPWDADWNCVNLATGQEHVEGASCAPLREASLRYFPLLPGGQPNRAPIR